VQTGKTAAAPSRSTGTLLSRSAAKVAFDVLDVVAVLIESASQKDNGVRSTGVSEATPRPLPEHTFGR
jgi:hypothetical protein